VLRLRDPEVDHLRRARLRDEHVLRRHIAMDHAERRAALVFELVCCMKPGARIGDDPKRDRKWKLFPLTKRDPTQSRERLAVDPLHDEVEDALLLSEIEDLRDVWMTDARCKPRFVEEHLLEARILAEMRLDRLYGDE